MLTVGSMFSGIGGFDLGLERAGLRVIWQAENDEYASLVLQKHWPDVPNYGDVTQVDWHEVERPDVITAGFPCQPVSWMGLDGRERDERWLWTEVVRCLRVLRPRFLLLENVPALLARGFEAVLGDISKSGYDAQWNCIPASSAGAPQTRERLFVVAYPTVANPEGHTFWPGLREGETPEVGWGRPSHSGRPVTSSWDFEPDLGGVAHGIPETVDAGGRVIVPAKWEQGVKRAAYGVPDRWGRMGGLGNAVVPQVAELLGRQLVEVADGWV